MSPILVFIAFAALIGGAGWLAMRQEKKRTLAMTDAARQLGWTLQADAPLHVIPNPARFELFTAGRRQHIGNYAAGERDGRKVAVFDYSYVTGAGKSQTTWRQTVVHVHSPRLDLPPFVLRPEHVFHKIGTLFGYQDIDLENDPVFSGQYLLRGGDEAAVRALFDAGVRDFYDRNAKSCTEAHGSDLFYWRTSRLTRPEDVPALVEMALDLASRLERSAPAPAGEPEDDSERQLREREN